MGKIVHIDYKAKRRPTAYQPNRGTEPLAWCHSRVECLQCREFYYPTQGEIVGCAGNKIPGFLCPICCAAVKVVNR